MRLASDSPSRAVTIPLAVLAVVVGSAGLVYAKSILIPFVLAILIAFTVSPVVHFFEERLRFPRSLALFAVTLCIAGLLTITTLMIAGTIKGALENVEVYQQNINALLETVFTKLERFGLDQQLLNREAILSNIDNLSILRYIQMAAGSIVFFLSDTFLVIIFVFFLLAGKTTVPQDSVFRLIDKRINTYLVTKTLTSALTGILTALILWLLDLDMAIMFGLLAFLLNFIPTVGSLVAAILPLPVALVQYQSIWPMVAALALPGVVQFYIGNIAEPKLMGDSLDLHPVTVMLGLMFWGLLWGVPGMFLAMPMVVVMKIALEQSNGGRVLANLMAGRLS